MTPRGRAVIALGGNALLRRGDEDTPDVLRANARLAAERIAEIAAAGWEIVLTHGNGPQVGRILLQNELAREQVHPLPLDVLGAESQGQIGYLLQVSIGDVFYERGMERPVATILTLTRVPEDDPAFEEPTKPIGQYYDHVEAAGLAAERGWQMAEVTGGWRRVVPSPRPYSIVEAPVIRQLAESGVIVIAAGGGGVPVVERGPRLEGVEGVVDKDRAAGILARDVEAQVLLILTDVAGVYERFGEAGERLIEELTVEEAAEVLRSLPEGSMGPKLEAAIGFVEQGGERAIIAELDQGPDALEGKAGTSIVRSHPG